MQIGTASAEKVQHKHISQHYFIYIDNNGQNKHLQEVNRDTRTCDDKTKKKFIILISKEFPFVSLYLF